jgi:hypothetical protein
MLWSSCPPMKSQSLISSTSLIPRGMGLSTHSQAQGLRHCQLQAQLCRGRCEGRFEKHQRAAERSKASGQSCSKFVPDKTHATPAMHPTRPFSLWQSTPVHLLCGALHRAALGFDCSWMPSLNYRLALRGSLGALAGSICFFPDLRL